MKKNELKKIIEILEHYRHGDIKLWSFQPSHASLVFRLKKKDKHEYLDLIIRNPEFISCKAQFIDVDIDINYKPDTALYTLTDKKNSFCVSCYGLAFSTDIDI